VGAEDRKRERRTNKKEREKRKKLAKANLRLANKFVKIYCSLIYDVERMNEQAIQETHGGISIALQSWADTSSASA
jgi:hypothetical protein